MDRNHIEDIILKLNTISRMAVIENAPDTERMLVVFTRVLKYRYQTENQMVIAEKELRLAEKMCDYYNVKSENMIEFIQQDSRRGLGSVLIPHFSLLSFYYCMFNILSSHGKKYYIRVQTDVEGTDTGCGISIVYTGNVDFKSVYPEIYEYASDEYVSIKRAVAVWQQTFGTGCVQINAQEDALKICLEV